MRVKDQQQRGYGQARGSKLLLACLMLCTASATPQIAAAQAQAGSNTAAAAVTADPTQGAASQSVPPSAQAQVIATPQQQQDAQIAVTLNIKLAASNTLRPLDIGVWVHDAGVVTLTGRVPTPALQQQAQAIVHSVSGVQRVENKIVVGAIRAQAPVPEPAPYSEETSPKQTSADQTSTAAPAKAKSSAPPVPAQPAPPSPMQQNSALGNNAVGYPNAQRPLIAAHDAPDQSTTQPPLPPQGLHAQQMQDDRPQMTLGVDTPLRVQVLQSLDSKHSQPGDNFRGVLAKSILVDGLVALPRGAPVEGTVVDAQDAGRLKGKPLLALQITNVRVGDAKYQLTTQPWMHEGPGKGGRTAVNIVGGTLLGMVIGSAGGGGGALVGGAIGGGAATGLTAMSSRSRIFVPAEATLTFRLTAPLVVREPTANEVRNAEANAPHPPRMRNNYPSGPPPGYPPIIRRSGPFPDDSPE